MEIWTCAKCETTNLDTQKQCVVCHFPCSDHHDILKENDDGETGKNNGQDDKKNRKMREKQEKKNRKKREKEEKKKEKESNADELPFWQSWKFFLELLQQ
ncbi:MAG: hypothetical protein LUG26_07380 [Ruminococcus sp.]|nr:hypothetical protein [Ruminococcus sp.]